MRKFLLLCISALSITACTEVSIQQQYLEAIQDAAIVNTKKVSNQLWAITENNPNLVWNKDKTKLLVVTWKKQRSSYDKLTTDVLWVTAAPQVKKFCQSYIHDTDEELNLRLKQYLGLAPEWQYDVFVELWVNKDDLSRPCVDSEVDDSQCEIEVPEKFTDTEHGRLYRNIYFDKFRGLSKYRAPWTGLGYTYDWGNSESKIGASEFILTRNSSYKIEQVLTTRKYCSK